MTHSPENNSPVGTPIAAILVVVLLLGVAILNLPSSASPLSKPYITTTQGVNVRSGPSTKFNPPIGSIAANQKADVIARSPEGLWFKIIYDKGFGWIFAAYTTLSIDVAQLPIDAGPPAIMPTLTPYLPTPVPAPTTSLQTTTNLVLGNVKFDPPLPLSCGQTVEIFAEVINLGAENTTSIGIIRVDDIDTKSNQIDASTVGGFGLIQSGQTVFVTNMFLNVAKDQDHKLVITVNPDGSIPETSSTDNSREFTYTLQGDC